jgi:mRNA-degrading endonuclease RelE of RelBE toxin-antitoxin system
MVGKVTIHPTALLTTKDMQEAALKILNEEFQRSYETPAETAKRRRESLLNMLRARKLTEELSDAKANSSGTD